MDISNWDVPDPGSVRDFKPRRDRCHECEFRGTASELARHAYDTGHRTMWRGVLQRTHELAATEAK